MDINTSPALENQLARLRKAVGVATDTALAKTMGITQGGISSAKKRGRVPDKWLVKIAERYSVRLEWLTTGKGPMVAEETKEQEPGRTPRQRQVALVGLAACGISGWYNPNPLALKAPVPVDSSAPNLFAIIATGCSMQPDGIRHGYLLFCDPDIAPDAGDAVFIEQADGTASVKRFTGRDAEWLHLQGWLDPDADGHQRPYTEKIALRLVKTLAPVTVIQRKA